MTVMPEGNFLSSQERRFIINYSQGFSPKAAARMSGMTAEAVTALMERQDVAEMVVALRNRQVEELGQMITRDFVGGMILEAHKKAATATEEIAAARELAKLYGLNAPEKNVTVTYNVTRIEQLEGLPDAELIRMAGMDDKRLALPDPIDVTPTEEEAIHG